jgi:hypothetical protein
MVIGRWFDLAPLHVFIATHLSGILVYGIGGFVFVRELTGDAASAVIAYVLLLFSGEACYWTNQVYSLAVIKYVPWLMYSALRYYRSQTMPRALVCGIWLAIAVNQYYPVYLITYGITFLFLLLVFYYKKVTIDLKKAVTHGLLVAPIIAVLILPTFLSYLEITRDHYQISRYDGPEQKERPVPEVSSADRKAFAWNALRSSFAVDLQEYQETVPFIGFAGVVLVIGAVLSFSRQALFWASLLLLTALHYAGPRTPFYAIDRMVMPFYDMMCSFGFYSGYLNFSAVVLAATGAGQVLKRKDRSENGVIRAISTLLISAGLIVLFRGDNMRVSLIVLALFTFVLLLPEKTAGTGTGKAALIHLLLIIVLAVGIWNMPRMNWNFFLVRAKMFTYEDKFNFSLVRPDTYTTKHADFFIDESAQSYATSYHLAEKMDGPYYFGAWRSPETLLVDKNYYDASYRPGFSKLTKDKVHFLRYAIKADAGNYSRVLAKSVLALEEDAIVDPGYPLREIGDFASMPSPDPVPPTVHVLDKTANTVTFRAVTAAPVYMLYTDLFHKGFRARIDGKQVPVLKAMDVFKAVTLPAGEHIVEFIFQPFFRYPLALYLVVSVGFIVHQLLNSLVQILTRVGEQPG